MKLKKLCKKNMVINTELSSILRFSVAKTEIPSKGDSPLWVWSGGTWFCLEPGSILCQQEATPTQNSLHRKVQPENPE